MRYVRSPNLILYWLNDAFLVEDFTRRRVVAASPVIAQVLNAFSAPQTVARVARMLQLYAPKSVIDAIEECRRLRFLVPSKGRVWSAAGCWANSLAAAHYDNAVRDLPFITAPLAGVKYLHERLTQRPQPRLYKNYPHRARISLPPPSKIETTLQDALRHRRTVRDFSRRQIPLETFTSLVRGTWGQTGWLDAGVLGKLVAKSSPSAGARHPIECYLIAWNVRGLLPGLYHYSVQFDCLERLRTGDFRQAAVRIASGFGWIGRAAFLCVMTAVKDRLLWKYPTPKAYALFSLDAGHLGQTFTLLATAHGMAPFTTAALQHTEVEKVFHLDGTSELPIYLCGAGTPRQPAAPHRSATSMPPRRGGRIRLAANR